MELIKKGTAGAFIMGCVFLSFCSCSSLRTSSVDVEYISKSGIMTKPMVAEIEVEKKKIQATIMIRKKDYLPNPLEAAKNLAIADAIKAANADLLVQPVFNTETKGGTITVTVIGFPAKYKEF